MALLIDGKAISAQIKDELKEEVNKLHQMGKDACLAVVQVGEDRLLPCMLETKSVPVSI